MTSTDVEQYGNGPGSGLDGLEDIETSDLTMPTIKINHKEAMWVDGLSGEEFPQLDCVLLGLVKQRVLWDVEVNDDPPFCKSYNFQEGHPDHARFPWKASGFDLRQEGTLPCTDCALKEWDTNPKGKTPWCSEQHTYILLQVTEDGDMLPAIMSIQRSALKPSKAYVSSFVKDKKPLYTVMTKLTLDARKQGTVDFAVPKFVRGPATDQANWGEFKTQYYSIRSVVTSPRVAEADPDDTAPEVPENAHPQAAAQPVQAAPAPSPAATSPGPAAEPTAAPEPPPVAASPAATGEKAPWDDDGDLGDF